MKPSDYVKKGWCQHSSALSADGTVVSPSDGQAQRWCLLGALDAAYADSEVRHKVDVIDALCRKFIYGVASGLTLIAWNDAPARTQQDVIDLLQSVGE